MARKSPNPGRAGQGHRGRATASSYNTFALLDSDNDDQLNDTKAPLVHDQQLNRGSTIPQLNSNVRKYFQQTASPVGEDWISSAEIPSAEEIMNEPSDPIVNNIEGPWSSNLSYLHTHWRLRREDAFRPLRKAIRLVQADPYLTETPRNASLRLYGDVFIRGFTFSGRGLGVKISFSLLKAQKQIQWAQSDRLREGSLVALINCNDTTDIKTAVVAARPLSGLTRDPPEIDLFFPNAESIDVDCNREWIMVEERGAYFEADRYTLAALQKMASEKFSFSDHLVQALDVVEPPKYLERSPQLDLTPLQQDDAVENLWNLNILSDWPTELNSTMDESQESAVKRILTKRLALCQGPPGTGKTFVTVKALQVFIRNMNSSDPPLIITCQTNHALDQLLRLIVPVVGRDFIRLGGRSKEKGIIKERTLFQVRLNEPSPRILGCMKPAAMKELQMIRTEMTKLLSPLEKDNGEVLSLKLLQKSGIISEKQVESLENADDDWVQADTISSSQTNPFEAWLGKQLEKVPPKRNYNILDFPFEEVEFDDEEISEEEAENVTVEDEEEIFKLSGEYLEIGDTWTARGADSLSRTDVEMLLQKHDDLRKIKPRFRPAVYRYFVGEVKTKIRSEFVKLVSKYRQATRKRQIGLWEQDALRLSSQKIIGVTTTGLAKNRGLLSSINPKVILIEEAAETLEASVIAACIPSLQHLVLVGDHKQLRPHCNVHELEQPPWNANVSLFERLVNNGLECTTLRRQRRMVPAVRELLEPIYGKGLIQDHPDVTNPDLRPHIPGMGKLRTYFFHHEWPEGRDHLKSIFNQHEASMVLQFIHYLSLNGVSSEQITVLSLYNGQKRLIQGQLRKASAFEGCRVKVVTVDSYQGEENSIIILSLARSNSQGEEERGTIGFLDNDNRTCVALSRAQRGMYVFGNGLLLATQSPTWEAIIEIFGTRPIRELGFGLRLCCTTHKRFSWIFEPAAWQQNHGGCGIKCTGILPCGHDCQLFCHPFAHEKVFCRKPCSRKLHCGHECSRICGEQCECEKCSEKGNVVPLRSKRTTQTSNPYTAWNHEAHDAGLASEQRDIEVSGRLAKLHLENTSLLFNVTEDLRVADSAASLEVVESKSEVSRSSEGKRGVWSNTYLAQDLTINSATPQQSHLLD